MAPFKFIPQLKPVLWGGRRITQLKHLPGGREPIGESWEISAMPGRESVVAQGDDAGLTLSQLLKKYGKWLRLRRNLRLISIKDLTELRMRRYIFCQES